MAMVLVWAMFLFALIVSAAIPSAEALASEGWDAGYEPGKVLVVFENGATKASAGRAVTAVSSVDAESVDQVAWDGPAKMAKVDVAEGATVQEAIAELEAEGAVAYAQPNYLYKALDVPEGRGTFAQEQAAHTVQVTSALLPGVLTPQVVGTNDKLRYKQWYLSSINAYKSWDVAKCEGNVTVAVLDTGITMDHYDLKDRIVAPYDVVGNARTDNSPSVPDNSPDDESGHGTHVAGIIAAQADNAFGTVGVSYNANVLPLKVCYYSDQANTYITSSEDLASAYSYLLSRALEDVNEDGVVGTYAEEYNVRVANMSLGALYDEHAMSDEELAADKAVLDLVDHARTRGILTVCAAGNENSSSYSWPSDHTSCVSVIALDKQDERASYSNYGPAKDIAAPGSDIFSTVPLSYAAQGTTVRDSDGNMHCYADMSGTSMASPVVAGVAAQVFAANPNFTPDDVEDILYATAVDLGDPGRDDQFGYGKVDAEAAVKAANSIAATSIEDLPTLAKAGEEIQLSGRVLPTNATNREVEFALVDAGTTGAMLSGDVFTAQAPGMATLTATVVRGGANGADLVRTFTITVMAPEASSGQDGADRTGKADGSDAAGTSGGSNASNNANGGNVSGNMAGSNSANVSSGTFGAASNSSTAASTSANTASDSSNASAADSGSSTSTAGVSARPTLRVSGLQASYPFTGSLVKPALMVTVGGRLLKAGGDYRVTYSGNRNVGIAKGKITLAGNYSGKAAFTFKITAPSVPTETVKKLSAGKQLFTVYWTKLVSSKATGYQVRYATAKSMKKAKVKTVSKVSTNKLRVKKLKAGKAYYVQVRAYKKIGGKTFYGAWSVTKRVKTKESTQK